MSNPYVAAPMSSIPLLPQTGDRPLPLQRFLNEVSTFTTQLQTLTAQVADVASLHDAALRSTELSSTSYTSGASARVDGAIADCSARARALKDFLKALEVDALLTQRHAADDAAAQQDAATKTGQCQRAKRDLQAVVREFEKTEVTYRGRYNEQLARQYRIVNPDATEAEIETAVASGDSAQVFSQAVLSSNRSAAAKSVVAAVRERQQDIARIEKTLEDLVALFEQMEEQVVLAEPAVEKIERSADVVVDDVEAAVVHLDKGVVSAKAAKRKKWWCLLIGIGIIAVILIIIAIVLSQRNQTRTRR